MFDMVMSSICLVSLTDKPSGNLLPLLSNSSSVPLGLAVLLIRNCVRYAVLFLLENHHCITSSDWITDSLPRRNHAPVISIWGACEARWW